MGWCSADRKTTISPSLLLSFRLLDMITLEPWFMKCICINQATLLHELTMTSTTFPSTSSATCDLPCDFCFLFSIIPVWTILAKSSRTCIKFLVLPSVLYIAGSRCIDNPNIAVAALWVPELGSVLSKKVQELWINDSFDASIVYVLGTIF